MKRIEIGILLCLAFVFLFISPVCVGQTAPVPEFFGIYATTNGKLIPLTGGRGSFTPPEQNLNLFDWNDMNAQPRKVLSLEGGDLRFTVFDAAVADASANIELYKLPFARNILPQQDALGQVGGLLGQISGQPQPKAAPVSMQKYVIAKTDALKIELLQKPIPGQPQMIQLVPEAPLEPGMYSIFALRNQGGQQVIVTVPFEWNSSSAEGAKPYCVDLAITGGYGGSMENHDARLEHPYYLAKQKYVECGAATSSTSATFDTAPGNTSGGGAGSAACDGYSACFKAGIKAYGENNLEAIAYFQAATEVDPKQGQAWYWLGVVKLKAHQIGQVGELAGLWDRALTDGSGITVTSCHERGIQPCERGNLTLSPQLISFTTQGAQLFNVPPQETEPGRIQNNASFAMVAYRFKAGGKNYTFDFVPSTWSTCKFSLVVQCPQIGYAEQLILTQYVAETLPKLASGAFGLGTGSATPVGPESSAAQPPAAGDANSHGANAQEADAILIDTDSGQVRVKNFHKRALGQDEFGDEILEKTPAYVIDYGAESLCSYDSKRKGCFSIDLSQKSDHTDELHAQHSLMEMLGVSLQDFCKLPVAVSSLEDTVTGSKVATPPGLCPNGQFHNQ